MCFILVIMDLSYNADELPLIQTQGIKCKQSLIYTLQSESHVVSRSGLLTFYKAMTFLVTIMLNCNIFINNSILFPMESYHRKSELQPLRLN